MVGFGISNIKTSDSVTDELLIMIFHIFMLVYEVFYNLQLSYVLILMSVLKCGVIQREFVVAKYSP